MAQAVFCGREEELEHLRDAWRIVTREIRPQLVAFVAESGLGKTRLVQEFYGWLAGEYRAGNEGGYWPLQLSQQEQNLVVNPDISGVNDNYVMPFLWWAVRLNDPAGRNQVLSNAVSTHLKALIPHLQPMYKARRAKKYLQDSGKTIASATLQSIPIVGAFIGLGKDAFELYQVGQKALQDKLLRPDEAEQQEGKDLNERVLADLGQLFRTTGNEAAIPMVWVIDDAHFSTADPSVVELFIKVIRTAQYQNWPLLVIVTHWEREWHEQVDDGSRLSLANSIKREYRALNPRWQPYRLKAIPDDALAPVLKASLPGLTAEQSRQILARANGNPRFLEEIILFCRARPRHFVGRSLENALTDRGLQDILEHSTNLHALVEARLLAAPKEVREVLTLSSLQGVRLLYLVSRKLVERLTADGYELGSGETKRALEQAQTPHAFINLLSDNLAEFSQRVFYEVARQGLEDIIDTEEALDALIQVLKELSQDNALLQILTDDEQVLLLELTAELLAQSEQEEDRQLALVAYAELTRQALSRYDYRSALQMAERILEGEAQGRWQVSKLSLYQLQFITDALISMGKLARAYTLALTMQEKAQGSGNERDLSVSFNKVGDIQVRQGHLDEALANYQESLAIRQELAESLRTPEAKRDLSVSFERVGDIQVRQGHLDEALANYQESLAIAQELAERLETPEAKRDLAVSYSRLALNSQALKHVDARTYLQAGLAAAQDYQRLQPYQDAENLVAWFEAQLAE